MRVRWVIPVALIAAVTTYAIFDSRFRHNEAIARTIAYGARRRALELTPAAQSSDGG